MINHKNTRVLVGNLSNNPCDDGTDKASAARYELSF